MENAPKTTTTDVNKLSIIVIIKNRTAFEVKHNSETLTLRLFEHNIDALIKLITDTDQWELVVVDFDSTDVDMKQFLEEKIGKLNKSNFTYKLHTIYNEKFCKGKGLNIAPGLASYDNLFYLDADMLITKRDIFTYAYSMMKQNKAYFPICMSYTGPEHKKANIRPSGKGNVFLTKQLMNNIKWQEYNKWGKEDNQFFDLLNKRGLTIRNDVNKTFFHQWHPNTLVWKNRFYK